MISRIPAEKMSKLTENVYDIIDSYNVMISLLNDENDKNKAEKIKIKLMEMKGSQAVLGENFRINVFENRDVEVIIKEKNTYDKIKEIEDNLTKLGINYKSSIDNQSKPLAAKFNIKVQNNNGQPDLNIISQLFEVIKLK